MKEVEVLQEELLNMKCVLFSQQIFSGTFSDPVDILEVTLKCV
jgi:hypothetical protein